MVAVPHCEDVEGVEGHARLLQRRHRRLAEAAERLLARALCRIRAFDGERSWTEGNVGLRHNVLVGSEGDAGCSRKKTIQATGVNLMVNYNVSHVHGFTIRITTCKDVP